MTTLFLWSLPPNLRTKSVLKEDNLGFGAKYSPDGFRIPNASGPGCVNVSRKVFLPLKTPYFSAEPVTIRFYLLCTNYSVVCDQRANESSSFVLLNASILGKYRGKQALRYASLQQFIEQ